MPESIDPADHVRPFVYEGLTSKALHFSICEIQSRMKLDDPYALDIEYTRTMMGFLLFQPAPRHIAMIGLGGGSMAKFCYRHLAGAHIHVVEINPHVLALRDEFHVPPDDHRFRVIRGDGAHFVRYRSLRSDVLVVDGFDSSGQPSRLCSQRFYDDCFEMLLPGGVLAVNLHSGHRHYDSFVSRIARSFAGSILVVDDGEASNSIVFACKGHALDKARPGVIRRPAGLDRAGAAQLQEAFAQVSHALQARQA
jgi:spermidine synthase